MQSKGTSYSTALTAGVAALWLEKHGAGLRAAGHNPAEIFMDVLAGCGLDPVTDGSGAPLDGWGYGRLDAAKILDYPVSY